VKPFRFGVVQFGADSRADWHDKARRVEDLGYSTLLVPDHVAQRQPPLDMFPPLVSLVSAAEATTTLRVGTFVMNSDFYHPALLARDAAAADLLTDGRLELGLGAGAGNMESEYRELGRVLDPARVRIERLAEAVAIIKALLAGEEVTTSGAHFTLTGHRTYPAPAQRPRPPILIGGTRPAILSLAGREADIVGFVGTTQRRGELDFSSFTNVGADAQVNAVREAAGARFGDLELNAILRHVELTDSPDAAVSALARELPVDDDAVRSSPYVLIGSVDGIAELLELRRERYGFSYWVAPERYMTALAPVVARLTGR